MQVAPDRPVAAARRRAPGGPNSRTTLARMNPDQPEPVAARAERSAQRWWRASWLVGLAHLFVTLVMLAALTVVTWFAGSMSEDPDDGPQRADGASSWLATTWLVGALLASVVLLAFVKIDRRERSGLIVLGGLGLAIVVIGWPWVADVLRPDLSAGALAHAIVPIWAMGLVAFVVSAMAGYRTRRAQAAQK